MKKLFLLLLSICILLAGCAAADGIGSLPAGESTASTQAAPVQTTNAVPEETTLPPAVGLTVTFQYLTAQNKEYAVISASDPAGNVQWSLETGHHEMVQLTGLWGIGSYENMYYYVESGDVVALDIATGTELWRNTEFGGAPGNERCFFIDDNGDIHLTGFFGPSYFRVSKQGQTIQKIPSLHKDYFWASSVQKVDGQIIVCFSGGPEGDMGTDYYKVPVEEP